MVDRNLKTSYHALESLSTFISAANMGVSVYRLSLNVPTFSRGEPAPGYQSCYIVPILHLNLILFGPFEKDDFLWELDQA